MLILRAENLAGGYGRSLVHWRSHSFILSAAHPSPVGLFVRPCLGLSCAGWLLALRAVADSIREGWGRGGPRWITFPVFLFP